MGIYLGRKPSCHCSSKMGKCPGAAASTWEKRLPGCCSSRVGQQQAFLHHQLAQALCSSMFLLPTPAHHHAFGMLLLPKHKRSMAS